MMRVLAFAALLLAAPAVDVDARERSASAKAEFRRANPCPATGKTRGACPGYEIDHRRPLAAGGADHPSNMQWLTKEQHRAKTRHERRACAYGCDRRRKP